MSCLACRTVRQQWVRGQFAAGDLSHLIQQQQINIYRVKLIFCVIFAAILPELRKVFSVPRSAI